MFGSFGFYDFNLSDDGNDNDQWRRIGNVNSCGGGGDGHIQATYLNKFQTIHRKCEAFLTSVQVFIG